MVLFLHVSKRHRTPAPDDMRTDGERAAGPSQMPSSLQSLECMPPRLLVPGTQISTFSMVVAAIVEVVRLGQVRRLGLQHSTDPVPMSVFWLTPQYFIIGAAEIMVNIGTLEMFYSEARHRPCHRDLHAAPDITMSSCSMAFARAAVP